jgi:hypothetical protein
MLHRVSVCSYFVMNICSKSFLVNSLSHLCILIYVIIPVLQIPFVTKYMHHHLLQSLTLHFARRKYPIYGVYMILRLRSDRLIYTALTD